MRQEQSNSTRGISKAIKFRKGGSLSNMDMRMYKMKQLNLSTILPTYEFF